MYSGTYELVLALIILLVFSEVENKEEVLSLLQMKNNSQSAPEKMMTPKAAVTGVACTPTSVIVKCVREPRPVTENIFQSVKQANSPAEPRAVTEALFTPSKAGTETGEGAGVQPITEDSDGSQKENDFGDDFFDELFSNLSCCPPVAVVCCQNQCWEVYSSESQGR